MPTLNQTLELVVQGIGQQTGQAIKQQINTLLGLPNVDIQALSATVSAIQDLVDSDPNEPGFQAGQNIIAQLIALGNRIDLLEGSTVVAELQVLVGNIETALATETAERIAADAALQASIDALAVDVGALTQQVADVVANQSGDLVALEAQVTALTRMIGDLTGTDAAQAAQIATLQAQIATLSNGLATANAAIAAAQASASSAVSTANSAAAGVAALQTALNAIDSRENNRHSGHNNRIGVIETDLSAVDATNLLAKHAIGLAAGLAA